MSAFQQHDKKLTEMEREYQEMKKLSRAFRKKLKRKISNK